MIGMRKRKSLYTELQEPKEPKEPDTFQEPMEEEPTLMVDEMTLCDTVEPNRIHISQLHIDPNPEFPWTVAFYLGRDSIRIDSLSNEYVDELKNVIRRAKQEHCKITLDFNCLNKRNPQSVYSTFQLEKIFRS